jgi:hypothetical protein
MDRTVSASVSKLLVFGKQAVSLSAGAKYYVESPDSGPHEFGARLFPTK